MIDLLTTLLPLAIVSAVTPIQVAIVVLMLQSDGGLARATAWVSGMTTVRLAQGVLFGLVLGVGERIGGDGDGPGPVASALLLVVGIVFVVSAVRKLLKEPDEDAPPPKWMAAVQSVRPVQAALMGAGYVGLSPKLWAFTIGAIGAIEAAALAPATAVIVFVLFIAAAQATHLLAIGATALAPSRALPALAAVSGFLQRWDRAIMVSLGLGFGAFLLVKALIGLGSI
jgi:hypothetical protein